MRALPLPSVFGPRSIAGWLAERSFAAPGGALERSLPIAECSGAWICIEVPLAPG